jgi:hypothetical protein
MMQSKDGKYSLGSISWRQQKIEDVLEGGAKNERKRVKIENKQG